MDIITDDIRAALAHNGERAARHPDFDPAPIVKLFTPDAGATWLLAWTEPDEPDIAFGLCDLGLSFSELGSVRLSDILALRGHLGLPVERDLAFRAVQRHSELTPLRHEDLTPMPVALVRRV